MNPLYSEKHKKLEKLGPGFYAVDTETTLFDTMEYAGRPGSLPMLSACG
jgi:hypothetical protein